MKNIILLLLSLISLNAYANLTCSRNGTKIIYVNGIKTGPEMNTFTAGKINGILSKFSSQIDLKGIGPVVGVHNVSRRGLSDLDETRAQIAINHLGIKREEYWRNMANVALKFNTVPSPKIKKMLNDAFDQVYRQKFKINPETGAINQNYYTELEIYKDLVKYDQAIANIFSAAYADDAVVEELTRKILEAYDNGKNKVIVIAHSQGNEVLFSAIRRINEKAQGSDLLTPSLDRWDQINNTWFNSVIGYVQIAPPSPALVAPPPGESHVIDLPSNNHSRLLRANADDVINSAGFANGVSALPANLTLDATKIFNISHFSGEAVLATLAKYYTKTTAFHGVDDFYLSDDYKATHVSGKKDTMLEHFKDAVKEVAGELSSNCKVTIPPPVVGLCQVWSRYGTVDKPIEYFAYEDQYHGMGLSLPTGYTFKGINTYCEGIQISNGIPVPALSWCLGHNNRILIQSIGGDIAFDQTYTSPCYVGRVLPQNGVVPL